MAVYITKCIVFNSLSSCVLAADVCTAAVGTVVGVSVSVTFVVSFSMGVLVACVKDYISSRSKESSHEPSSHADRGTNKKMKGHTMEMDAKTACGTHVSSTVYDGQRWHVV